MWLSGQTVFITGGTRGIGRATALRLAAERPQHMVLGYVLDHDSAQTALAEVQASGVEASLVCGDVGDETEMRRIFGEIAQKHGRLDVFVSNAARGSFGPLMDVSTRSWQKMLDLNARAFLIGSQLAASMMPAGGRIVALSSLGSRQYLPGYGMLGAIKAMIESLVRSLAVELSARGIRVNAVCGGFVDTGSTRLLPMFEEVAERVSACTPMARVATPEDIAGVVAMLCSPDAAWIQGQTVVADGGYSLQGA